MKIAEAYEVVVQKEKITEYLLNKSHPDGMSKAKFFLGLGFTIEKWKIFSDRLLNLCENFDVFETETTKYGTKYVINGTLNTPDNRNPKITTIWFVGKNELLAKLVTAYPYKND